MKKIYEIALSFFLILGFSGCGGDNAYDGETGLHTSEVSQTDIDISIERIYKDVILEDINETYEQSLVLLASVEDLNETNSTVALLVAQDAFKKLTLAYKKVESAYVAGRESDDMRDLADFYIEQFIFNSKGDTLFTDLQKIFDGTGSLYKNSHKGITALEYTLFDYALSTEDVMKKMNTIRLSSAVIMAQTISQNLLLVQNYYENESPFLINSDDAVSVVLNQLVDNAYKLKEKRIGDAGGLTEKYKDNPDSTRLEYYKSVHSLAAIKTILQTHQRVMGSGLEKIAALGNASSEAEAINAKINEALTLCEEYSDSLESEIGSSNTNELYNAAAQLQANYTALINGLNFEQDLLEADGD